MIAAVRPQRPPQAPEQRESLLAVCTDIEVAALMIITRPRVSPQVAIAKKDATGRPVGELGNVARGDVLQPDSEPGAKLGQVPQDVPQFHGQGFPVRIGDYPLPVPEDLLHLPSDFSGLVGQPQGGIDDGMIGCYRRAGTRGGPLIGAEVKGF
jgi:hypothetical protein